EAARDPDDGQRLGAVACRDGRRGGRGGGRGGRRGAGCGGRGWFRRGRCCAGRGGRGRCGVPGGQGLGDVGEGAVLEEEGAAALPQVLLQPGVQPGDEERTESEVLQRDVGADVLDGESGRLGEHPAQVLRRPAAVGGGR